MDIMRIDPTLRTSGLSVYNGMAFFTAFPTKPYLAGTSAGEQMEQMLANIETKLGKIGSTKSDLLYVQIFIAHGRYFDEINAVWDAWIDPENPPSRICKGALFTIPELKIEASVTAVARDLAVSAV